MTDAKKEKIVDRVRKLLAKADNNDNIAESELAASMAEKLMRQHAIEQADITDAEKEEIGQGVIKVTMARWKRELLWVLCNHCNTKAVYYSGLGKMSVTGYASDIEILQYLFALCVREIGRGAKTYRKTLVEKRLYKELVMWGGKAGGQGWMNVQLRDFRTSAVVGVSSKLYNIRKAANAEAETTGDNSTALVSCRKNNVIAAHEAKHSNAKPDKGSTAPRGFNAAGYRHGENISMSSGIEEGKANELGGGN